MKCLNGMQRNLIEQSRLGIPAFVFAEGLHGFMANGTTSFPQAIALGMKRRVQPGDFAIMAGRSSVEFLIDNQCITIQKIKIWVTPNLSYNEVWFFNIPFQTQPFCFDSGFGYLVINPSLLSSLIRSVE
jgi:hypothetical protein